jgi:hypothetical protein
MEQVTNIKKNQRRSDRFCHDAFYNIIDSEVKEFITYYWLFPNVVVFGYNDALLTKLRTILGREDLPNEILTVDTTFKLGDFYCTVFCRDRVCRKTPHPSHLHATRTQTAGLPRCFLPRSSEVDSRTKKSQKKFLCY